MEFEKNVVAYVAGESQYRRLVEAGLGALREELEGVSIGIEVVSAVDVQREMAREGPLVVGITDSLLYQRLDFQDGGGINLEVLAKRGSTSFEYKSMPALCLVTKGFSGMQRINYFREKSLWVVMPFNASPEQKIAVTCGYEEAVSLQRSGYKFINGGNFVITEDPLAMLDSEGDGGADYAVTSLMDETELPDEVGVVRVFGLNRGKVFINDSLKATLLSRVREEHADRKKREVDRARTVRLRSVFGRVPK